LYKAPQSQKNTIERRAFSRCSKTFNHRLLSAEQTADCSTCAIVPACFLCGLLRAG